MDTIILTAEAREVGGTRVARALRKTGRLPAIIYGHKETPEAVSLGEHDLEVALTHGARVLELEIGGSKKPYLIKAIQYDHLGAIPIHVDLTRVDLDERVHVTVGIELRGVPKGVHEGGVLEQDLRSLHVECLVTAIPDTLHPFVTHLNVGDSLLVSEIDLPEGVVATTDPNERVATVRALQEEVEAEPGEEGEEKTTMPEVIGRARDEDAEGEKSS